jgi:prostaglandin-H2 D-isomerase / glutathione transferase
MTDTQEKLRFIYFDFPFWRAEASRIALHMGGIAFEDVRPGREEFRAMKASGELPYGQLPVLDVGGVRIAQSVAIARFCGKRAGLYPTSEVDQARVDELMDTATQITGLLGPSFTESDPERRAELRAKLVARELPKWFGFLEARLLANGDSGFLVGDQLTIADLLIWKLLGWFTGGILDGIPKSVLDGHLHLQAHFQTIDALPQVREWMDRHYGASD